MFRSICLSLILVLAPAAATQAAQFTVMTIRATKDNNNISKELKPLVKKLKGDFRFTGFTLVKKESKPSNGGKASFSHGKGFSTSITSKGATPDGKHRFAVQINQKKGKETVKKLATTISLKPGVYQLIGGPKYEGKDVLFLAVMVK